MGANYQDEDLKIRANEGYFPAIPNDVTERILSAIDNFYCTLTQIKKRAGFAPYEDISIYLEKLEDEGKIKRIYNGTLTGWFRAEKVPTKFWIIPGGKVGVDFTPLPEPDRSKIGQVVDFSLIAARQPILSEYQFKHSDDNRWTEDYVRELAELGLSRKETAKKAGVSESFLIQKLTNDRLQIAWDEGRRNFGTGNVQKEKIDEVPPVEVIPERAIPKGILDAPSKEEKVKNKSFIRHVENVAATAINIADAAKRLNFSVRELNMKMRKNPDIQAAYNRGRQKHKEFLNQKNKEKSMQAVQSASPKNAHSRMLIQVSEADIEKYAAKADGKTLKEVQGFVAQKCGISWSTLMKKLANFPHLKAAFDRGREQSKNLTETSKAKKGIEYTAEMFFDFGKRKLNVTAIGKELGIVSGSVNWQLKKPEFYQAYTRGLASKTNETEAVKPKEEKSNERDFQVLKAIKSGIHEINLIIENTGLDKSFVIASIQNLLRDGLIEKQSDGIGEPQYSISKEIIDNSEPSIEHPKNSTEILNQTEEDEASWKTLSDPFPVSNAVVIEEPELPRTEAPKEDPREWNLTEETSQSSNYHVEINIPGTAKIKNQPAFPDDKIPLAWNKPAKNYLIKESDSILSPLPSKLVPLGGDSMAMVTLIGYNPFNADERCRTFVEDLVKLVTKFNQENLANQG